MQFVLYTFCKKVESLRMAIMSLTAMLLNLTMLEKRVTEDSLCVSNLLAEAMHHTVMLIY